MKKDFPKPKQIEQTENKYRKFRFSVFYSAFIFQRSTYIHRCRYNFAIGWCPSADWNRQQKKYTYLGLMRFFFRFQLNDLNFLAI